MSLCLVKGEKPHFPNDKHRLKCHRCLKLGPYACQCSVSSSESRGTECGDCRPSREIERRAFGAILQSKQQGEPPKMDGSVRAGRPTYPENSRECTNLLTKVAQNTQSLCVSAPGDEVSLITLKLKVAKDFLLRALVDCGASNNFVLRQSLEGRRLKFVERDTPLTRMTVRLATRASIAVEKLV